jgi:mannose-6-phosphate isomerase
MHLFEALLALYEATGDSAHLQRASALAALFRAKMFDASRGAVLEFFDADWRPMSDTFGQIVEPGHVFEWSWLLTRWRALDGGDLDAEAEQLRGFGERYGVDERGVVRDQISIDGAPRKATSRLWTNTERLKANLVRFEHTGEEAAASAALQAFEIIMAYCDAPTRGLWRDQRLADGGYADEPTPASILYHIAVALAELLRVAELQDTRS